MSEHQDHLAPEQVDEYIQQYPKLLNSDDAYLVNDLQQYYQGDNQRHQQTLQNVWNRLRESQEYKKHAVHALLEDSQLSTQQQHYAGKNRIIDMQQISPSQGNSKRKKVSLFLTTTCVLALVASMLIVFNIMQVNSNKNKSHVASNTTTRVIPTHHHSRQMFPIRVLILQRSQPVITCR
ncbi:hypothetical protein [Dictyobacter kobayashii]|uniref:Uncharacterized protein n=1 Tax=Dictyobacter kobayashii TaxID=2014872 RepID=A0A402AEQ1_9CHLR|nr:hypothetical protein [Dictyobacter kobayashii]GCE17597.1 hypothetical protein KDK_13970 [Dictyobacter kobayashii]